MAKDIKISQDLLNKYAELTSQSDYSDIIREQKDLNARRQALEQQLKMLDEQQAKLVLKFAKAEASTNALPANLNKLLLGSQDSDSEDDEDEDIFEVPQI